MLCYKLTTDTTLNVIFVTISYYKRHNVTNNNLKTLMNGKLKKIFKRTEK